METESIESLSIDQEAARKLFEEGGNVIFLDVPVGTEFGIDWNSWNTGEKFKGIKMIPPGLHFIYYSAVNKDGQPAPRTGFFHNFQRKEIYARKYCSRDESMVDTISDEEKEKLQQDLKNLDQYLGAYPFQNWKKWLSLSNYMTVAVVEKIEPSCKVIASVADLIPISQSSSIKDDSDSQPRQRVLRANLEDALLPNMQQRPGTELRFSKIPSVGFPAGATAAEVTHYSIDSSYSLKQLIAQWDRAEQLLGELQMAFLCFLIGQVYSAFEQWKKLVHIICSADELLLQMPHFFIDFIGVFYFQMQEIPGDFFVDIVSQENFLTRTLRIFFSNTLENEQIDQRLRKRARQLQQYLTQRFSWDFSSISDEDEDAPVVVELDQDAYPVDS